MRINCAHCQKEFSRKPSRMVAVNYCSQACISKAKYIEGPCGNCGKHVSRLKCATKNAVNLMCCRKCLDEWNSKRFTDLNVELNPTRMVLSTRLKLRNFRLNTGEGKCYEKTFGVHTHRIVAAIKIGRALLPGEVVHHIDEVKRNNAPENLEVFKNQAEHARHHINKIHNARIKRSV